MQHTGEVLAACHSPASAPCRCQSHLRPNCLRWKVANCVKELLRLFHFLKLSLGDAWFAFDCAGGTSPLARDFTHYRGAFPFAKNENRFRIQKSDTWLRQRQLMHSVVRLLNAAEQRMVYFTGELKFMASWLQANSYSPPAFIVMSMK